MVKARNIIGLALACLAVAACSQPTVAPIAKATDPGYESIGKAGNCLVYKMRDVEGQRLIYVTESQLSRDSCSIAVQWDGVGPGN